MLLGSAKSGDRKQAARVLVVKGFKKIALKNAWFNWKKRVQKKIVFAQRKLEKKVIDMRDLVSQEELLIVAENADRMAKAEDTIWRDEPVYT